MSKGTRLYEDYLSKKKREKQDVKQLQESVDQEIEMIKRYLDEEDVYILKDKGREKNMTDDALKRIEEEYRKLNEEIIDPLKKKLVDMQVRVTDEKVLEDKGVQDVELDDVLDDDDGIKQGLKVD